MSSGKKKNVRLTRETARRILAELPVRAHRINADETMLYRIERMAVFGSYLISDKLNLGDLDIAVDLAPKDGNPNTHWEKCQAKQSEAPKSGSYVQSLFWAQTEVLRALRQRNYCISLHEYPELAELKAKHEIIFP